MSKDAKNKAFKIESTEQLLTLMSIYLEEFNQRNVMLWKQVFIHYFAIVIVMILPYMSYFGIDFGNTLPKWIFQAIGLLLSFVFLIVSLGYSARLACVSATYNELIQKLEPEYRRKSMSELSIKLNTKISQGNMTTLICLVMYITLIILGIVLLAISLKG